MSAIAGFCLGGGLALAAACDLRPAATGSRFGIPAARLDVRYFYAGAKRIVDLVGPAQVKRLIFTAGRFDAEEMLRIGLIDELLPNPDLQARVASLANGIATNATLSLRTAKLVVETACAGPAVHDLNASLALEQACSASEDHLEGRRTFMEKRTAVFHGR